MGDEKIERIHDSFYFQLTEKKGVNDPSSHIQEIASAVDILTHQDLIESHHSFHQSETKEFENIISRIFTAIIRFFRVKTQKEKADEHIQKTHAKLSFLRNLEEPAEHHFEEFTQLMTINERLLVNPDEQQNKLDDRELIATCASAPETPQKKSLYTNVPPLTTNAGNKKVIVKAYVMKSLSAKNIAIEPDQCEVNPDQVTPTSFILGGKDKSNLVNCYVVTIGDQQKIIRSGVIDTGKKADQMYALLKHIYDNTPTPDGACKQPMRIVSQQLNSPEREDSLIRHQHRFMVRMNADLREAGIGEIVHMNTPTNRFYHFTKKIKKIPLIGSLVEDLALSGEKKSKLQNIEAWPTYIHWFEEDLLKAKNTYPQFVVAFPNPEIKQKEECDIRKIQCEAEEVVRIIGYLEQKIYYKSGDLKKQAAMKEKLEMKLAALRSHIKSGLTIKHQELKELESNLIRRISQISAMNPNDYTQSRFEELSLEKKVLKEICMKATLMKDILADQLDIPGEHHTGRGRLDMSLHLLHGMLGVISLINCMSGLDRTGFLFAVKIAMEQMQEKIGPVRVFDMVQHWGSTTREINQRIYKDGLEKFNQWLLAPESDIKKKILKKRMMQVIEFRKMVLDNLIRFGLPITCISTGLNGLKWHKGMKENLIPLNFIPPLIQLENENSEKKEVQIVNYDARGKPSGLTKYGHRLLTHLSSMRGS